MQDREAWCELHLPNLCARPQTGAVIQPMAPAVLTQAKTMPTAMATRALRLT